MTLTAAEIGRGLGRDRKLVARYRDRGMPMDSVESAAAWMTKHVRPRVTPAAEAETKRAKAGAKKLHRETNGAPAQKRASPPPSPYLDARTRSAVAEAHERELAVLERRGVLVHRDVVRREIAKRIAALRDGLLQIPARLQSVLAAEDDEAKVHDLLADELHLVLAQFGQGAP